MRLHASTALFGGLASFSIGLLPGVATAAHYDLSFSAGPASVFSLNIGTTHYDQYVFYFGDLTSALTLSAGDSITATVDFPGGFTLPHSAPVYAASYLFGLDNSNGGGFPDVDTGSSGSVTLKLGGVDLLSAFSGVGTHGQITFGTTYSFLPLPTMDQAVVDFTIDTLSQPGDVNRSFAYFTNFSPAVPEPASALMLLSGLVVSAAAARRRRAADRSA